MLLSLVSPLLEGKECSRFFCVNVNVAHIWKVLESRHVTDGNKDDFPRYFYVKHVAD